MTNMIADEAVAKSSVLSVFDFDGTLTHHDSFIRSCALPLASATLLADWYAWPCLRCTVCAAS